MRDPNPLEAAPVDGARIGSADEVARWSWRKSVTIDLNGDGDTEQVVLVSDVTLREPGGQPLWEDGHRWAAFVESEGRRTLLYGAFVPNGFVEMAVGTEESDGKRSVIISERSPHHLRVMDIAYSGPGAARLRSDGHYAIEQWSPGSATLQ